MMRKRLISFDEWANRSNIGSRMVSLREPILDFEGDEVPPKLYSCSFSQENGLVIVSDLVPDPVLSEDQIAGRGPLPGVPSDRGLFTYRVEISELRRKEKTSEFYISN